MKALLIYGTVEGQSRKIVEHLESVLGKLGHSVRMLDAGRTDDVPSAGEFDAVMLVAPVHAGHFPSSVRRFFKTRSEALMARPGAFISVSLAAASDDPDEVEEVGHLVTGFSDETGWWPVSVHHAAGALKYTEYDFFRRWMMKRIAAKEGGPTDTSRDHEFTDWGALDKFAIAFLAQAPNVAGKI